MHTLKYLLLILVIGQSATAMEPEIYSDPRAMSSGARQFIRDRFADLNKELKETTEQLNHAHKQSQKEQTNIHTFFESKLKQQEETHQKELANLHTSNSVLSGQAREQFEKSIADKQSEYNSERESIIKHFKDLLSQEQARSEQALQRLNQLRESSFMILRDTLGQSMREDYNKSLAITHARLEREKIAYTSGSLAGTAMSLKGLLSLSVAIPYLVAEKLGMRRCMELISHHTIDTRLFMTAELDLIHKYLTPLNPSNNTHSTSRMAIILGAPIALTTLGYLAKKKCDNQKNNIQRQLITLARHSLPVATVPLCLEPIVQKNESARDFKNDDLSNQALADAAYYFADVATATLDTYSV